MVLACRQYQALKIHFGQLISQLYDTSTHQLKVSIHLRYHIFIYQAARKTWREHLLSSYLQNWMMIKIRIYFLFNMILNLYFNLCYIYCVKGESNFSYLYSTTAFKAALHNCINGIWFIIPDPQGKVVQCKLLCACNTECF